jgi:hypothetical protein
MGKASKIQQFLVGGSNVANGDFSLDLVGKITGVRVSNLVTAGANVFVGWNSGGAQGKDILVPGAGKPYGIEGHYLTGTLYVNFDPNTPGDQKCLVEVWTEQPDEIC